MTIWMPARRPVELLASRGIVFGNTTVHADLILDDGNELRFGHKQEDVERLYACQAAEHPMPMARRPSERFISLRAARLDFDRGLLKRVTFEAHDQFKNPLTPYPEPWKNFAAIESRRIYGQMPRDEFLLYVEAWKERAVALGAEQAALDELRDGQFAVAAPSGRIRGHGRHQFWTDSRKTSRGGIWRCDKGGWRCSRQARIKGGACDPHVGEPFGLSRRV